MEAQKGLNEYFETLISTDDAITALLNGSTINHCVLTDEEEYFKFTENKDTLQINASVNLPTTEIDVDSYFEQKVTNWLIPEKYKRINIKEYIYKLCETDKERARVDSEYKLYEEYNLTEVLKLFVYLVDYFRQNNIVWGVGRGSSVSSYILYLIGVHKINSIDFDLDIKEFLKG